MCREEGPSLNQTQLSAFSDETVSVLIQTSLIRLTTLQETERDETNWDSLPTHCNKALKPFHIVHEHMFGMSS